MFAPRNSCKKPVFIELFWDMREHSVNIFRRVPSMSELYSPGPCFMHGPFRHAGKQFDRQREHNR